MESKKDRKHNYRYIESKFYRSGPMPYWPKKNDSETKKEPSNKKTASLYACITNMQAHSLHCVRMHLINTYYEKKED